MQRKPFRGLFTAALVAGTFAAAATAHDQSVRIPTQLDASTDHIHGPDVDTHGDLSAAAWLEHADDGIYVTTSDGRGTKWSTAMRVDNDTAGSNKEDIVVEVVQSPSGESVYVAWIDDRNGSDELHIAYGTNVVPIGGGSGQPLVWLPDVEVNKGYAAGTGGVVGFQMEAKETDHGDHIWIPTIVDAGAGGNNELRYIQSHNGGASFFDTAIGAAGNDTGGNVTAVDFEVLDGSEAHIAWIDDRSGMAKAYYQHRSGGAFLVADGTFSTTGAVNEVAIDGDNANDKVALALVEDMGGKGVVKCSVSADDGTTWSSLMQVGGYIAGLDNAHSVDVAIDEYNGVPNNSIMIAWVDDRFGANEVFGGYSADDGATYTESGQVSLGGGGLPQLFEQTDASGYNYLTYFDQTTTGMTTPYMTDSGDGTSWHPPYDINRASLQAGMTAYEGDHMAAEMNPLYDNLVVVAALDVAGSEHAFAGGYRRQNAEIHFDTIANTITWDAQPKDDPDFPFAYFVLSSSNAGDFPLSSLGDGRTLDLTFDALFNLSIANPTYFLIPLTVGAFGASGQGTPLPHTLPAGFSFYSCAVSFDLVGTIGNITDSRLATTP